MNDLVSIIDSNRAEIARRLPSYMSEAQFFNMCYAIKRNKNIVEVAQQRGGPQGRKAPSKVRLIALSRPPGICGHQHVTPPSLP